MTVMDKALQVLKRFALAALIVLGGAVTAFCWIVSSPTGGGPDDDFHIASILCPTPIGEHCQIVGYFGDDPSRPLVEVPARVVGSTCFAFKSEQSAGCLYKIPVGQMTTTVHLDNGGYPGPYYDIMHWFSSPSPDALERTVLLVRTVNAAISALFFAALAWLLPWSMKRLLAYVLVGLSVPMVVYFLTSINPSAWAMTGVIAAWFALTGLFATEGDPDYKRWKRRTLAGVAVAAAALASSGRVDGGTYSFVAVLAVGAFHLPQIKPRLWRQHRLTWATMLAVAVIGIIGTFSGSQTEGALGLTGQEPGNIALFMYNIKHLPDMFWGYWSVSLGWFDVPMLPLTTVLVTIVGFGLVFSGLRRMSWPKALAAGGVLLVYLGVPLFTLQMGNNIVGQNVQARYVAPLMLVLVAVLLSRRHRDGGVRLSLAQTWVTYALMVVAHSWALHELIRRYVSGLDIWGSSLNGNIQWWRDWLPMPRTLWVIGTMAFALLALVLFVVRRKDAGVVVPSERVATEMIVSAPVGTTVLSAVEAPVTVETVSVGAEAEPASNEMVNPAKPSSRRRK